MNLYKVLTSVTKVFLFSIILGGIVNASPLYIEISGGQTSGLPIAILNFNNSPESSVNISKIINDNLKSSGQFSIKSEGLNINSPSNLLGIDLSYWQDLGVEHLVVGNIEHAFEDKYNISYQLINVYKNKFAKGSNKVVPTILNKRFDAINLEDFRALAHYISDEIFNEITGIKGIFSTRIAYVAVKRNEYDGSTLHQLLVADADGHNPKVMYSSSEPILSPSWSPDSKKIAFSSFEGNRATIKILDVSTSDVSTLTNYPGINGGPTWSPDGKELAMVLSKDGVPKIYIMELESKNIKKITNGGSIDAEPSYAPDGKSIVFTSNRGGKPQIYQVILATGETKRLTFNGKYNARPAITPDGKNLVMMHKNDDGVFSIAVQSIATGRVRVITNSNLDESPSLAPNGMMVIYGALESGRSELGAVSLDGRFKMRLPSRVGNVQEPAWSPFLTS